MLKSLIIWINLEAGFAMYICGEPLKITDCFDENGNSCDCKNGDLVKSCKIFGPPNETVVVDLDRFKGELTRS